MARHRTRPYLGRDIPGLLRHKGVLLKTMAAEIGMHPSNLSPIVNGKAYVGGIVAHRIANYFGLPVERVFTEYR